MQGAHWPCGMGGTTPVQGAEAAPRACIVLERLHGRGNSVLWSMNRSLMGSEEQHRQRPTTVDRHGLSSRGG